MRVHHSQPVSLPVPPPAWLMPRQVPQTRVSIVTVGLTPEECRLIEGAPIADWTLRGRFDQLDQLEPGLRTAGVRVRMLVLCDWAAISATSRHLDRVLAIRHERPDLCILVKSDSGRTDLGLERLALCDATIGRLADCGPLAPLFAAALKNNRVWQKRRRESLRQILRLRQARAGLSPQARKDPAA